MQSRAAIVLLLAACATRAPVHAPGGAALPYQILDGRTGRQLDDAWSVLARARAVCIGEDHNNPHHHWAQLEIATHLVAAWRGHPLALGMEMFARPFQGVLDDYAAGKIDAKTLRERTGWDDRWGFDYGFYGPTIDLVVSHHGALLALDAPRELTKQVAHEGLDSLSPAQRAQVPELKLDDATHRAWFDAIMREMGDQAHASKDSYTVQVIWDETMADTAATWLVAHPGGHALLLAGNGHCHDSAVVGRIKRRGIAETVSVRPILSTEDVAELVAKPINDYVFVLAVHQ